MPSANKRIIPEALKPHEAPILDFWRVKKGSKNDRAWSLLMTELGKILTKHGGVVLLEQLALGTQAGTWNSITLSRYEQFKQPRGNGFVPPEPTKHPASREFRNGRFVDEEPPVTNPALEGLF